MAPVLRAMNTPEEIIGGAFTYLRIMFAGIPIIMAYNVLASILRALGDSKNAAVCHGHCIYSKYRA